MQWLDAVGLTVPYNSGTSGASLFASMFPDHVGNFALDGVAPIGSVRFHIYLTPPLLTVILDQR